MKIRTRGRSFQDNKNTEILEKMYEKYSFLNFENGFLSRVEQQSLLNGKLKEAIRIYELYHDAPPFESNKYKKGESDISENYHINQIDVKMKKLSIHKQFLNILKFSDLMRNEGWSWRAIKYDNF